MISPGILILEGPDCAGKTTLARYLEKEHGAIYLHHGWSPRYDVGRRFFASLRRAGRLAAEGKLVVIDRLWLSADAYGSIYRGASDVPRRGRMLQRLALKYAAVTVLCVPPVEAVVEAHRREKKKRAEMYDDVRAVAEWYARLTAGRGPIGKRDCYGDLLAEPGALIGKRRAHFTTYDWTVDGHDLAFVAEELFDLLYLARDAQASAGLNPRYTNFAGHSGTARALMIGDRPGPRASAIRWPFMSGEERTGCSGWFAEKLTRAGIYEEDLAWVNAYPDDLREDRLKNWLSLKWDLIVPLGTNACERLARIGQIDNPVLLLEHPQYRKRFRVKSPGYLTPLAQRLYEGRT